MRLREIKKGMKVRVKKLLEGFRCGKGFLSSVGKEGKVVHISKIWEKNTAGVFVSFGKGRRRLCFHHRELEQVKPTFINTIKEIGYGIIELQRENQKLENEVNQLRKELKICKGRD